MPGYLQWWKFYQFSRELFLMFIFMVKNNLILIFQQNFHLCPIAICPVALHSWEESIFIFHVYLLGSGSLWLNLLHLLLFRPNIVTSASLHMSLLHPMVTSMVLHWTPGKENFSDVSLELGDNKTGLHTQLGRNSGVFVWLLPIVAVRLVS